MKKSESKRPLLNWKPVLLGGSLFLFAFVATMIALGSFQGDRRDKVVKKVFNKDKPSHRILAKILISSHHSTETPPESDLAKKYHEELNKSPQESFDDIRQGLAAMPVENYYFDRAALLYSAAQLKVDRKLINELAWSEFSTVKLDPQSSQISYDHGRPSDRQIESFNRASEQAVLPITAAAIMIGTGNSPFEIMNQVIAALHIQQHPGLQQTIVSIFDSKYPNLSPVFHTLLKKEGLAVAANDNANGN